VGIVKNGLRKTTGSVRQRLNQVLLHYRNTPHSVTGVAPAISLNGRIYVTEKERINPRYEPERCPKNPSNITIFQVGDLVYALNLRDGPKWLAGTIQEKIGINMYKIHVSDLDVIWTRHVEQLLKRKTNGRDDDPKGNRFFEECLKESHQSESVIKESMPCTSASGNESVNVRNDCVDEPSAELPDSNENTPVGDTARQNTERNSYQPRRSTRQKRPVDRYIAGDNSYIAW
jgi:hypothetical protein